jgi:hypothetical protein
MYYGIEVWSQKSASKDRTNFLRKRFLSRQEHTLRPRREWAPSNDLRLRVPVGNPTLIGLDLPLTALVDIAERWRNNLTYGQKNKNNKRKVLATTLNKTYPSWPKAQEF